MSDELLPLWDDDRILTNMEDEGAYADSYIGEKAFRVFKRMRDEYEANRRGQPANNAASAGVWMPVDHVVNGADGVYADELAITIGYDDTAMATFTWPEEGRYAVCRLTTEPQPPAPQAMLTDEVIAAIETASSFWLKQMEQGAKVYVGASEDLPEVEERVELVMKWLEAQRPQ